jgi:glycosyltransferase involved in cell wall biosynthesis
VLKKCIDSVFNQTYNDFKIFLIGDDFVQLDLLDDFLQQYDKNKIEFINIPLAVEREKYFSKNKLALWSSGGVNARNFGINYALTKGYSWVCSLDHDDSWRINHLEELKNAIDKFNPDIVFTKSTCFDGRILPPVQSNSKYIELLPISENTIHSSVCINFLKIPLRYLDFFEITKSTFPADALMWRKIKDYSEEKKVISIFINELTCDHLFEGFEKK